MKLAVKNGVTSLILRVKILDNAVTTGAGKTGLTHSSSGLIVSTIADNEATATAYTQAASNVETITTLGTFAAPTASKCRFKEVDATNHPGLYEIHIANARWAVSSARSVIVSVTGVSGAAQVDAEIQLDPVPANALQINDSATAAVQLARSAATILACIASGVPTTTSIPTSSCTPAGSAADQFKGRIIIFDANTTTVALRGQATDITASSASATPTFTVTALTTAPASGDIFIVV
jgi:hypothetical protein